MVLNFYPLRVTDPADLNPHKMAHGFLLWQNLSTGTVQKSNRIQMTLLGIHSYDLCDRVISYFEIKEYLPILLPCYFGPTW